MIVVPRKGWSRQWGAPWPARFVTVAVAAYLAACTSPPRDLDQMVWSRPDWDPGQEQRDYAQCFENAKLAAYRTLHRRRLAVSRGLEQVSTPDPPAVILSQLREIAADEKAAALAIAEQCMMARGYVLVRIDQAR